MGLVVVRLARKIEEYSREEPVCEGCNKEKERTVEVAESATLEPCWLCRRVSKLTLELLLEMRLLNEG